MKLYRSLEHTESQVLEEHITPLSIDQYDH